jgi:hypothetical protein
MTRHVRAAVGRLRRAASVVDRVSGGVPSAASSSVSQPVAATGVGQDAALRASEVEESSSLRREPILLPGNDGATGPASTEREDRAARVGKSEVPPAHGRRKTSGRQPGPRGKGEEHRDQAVRAAHVGGIYVIAAAVIGAILTAIFTNGFGLFAAADHGVATTPPSRSITPLVSRLSSPRQVVEAYLAAVSQHNWPRVWKLGGKNLGQTYRQMVAGYRLTGAVQIFRLTATGNTVAVRVSAYESTGLHCYALRYVVRRGEIVAGQTTPLPHSGC